MSRVSPPIRTTVPTAGRAEFHAFREALQLINQRLDLLLALPAGPFDLAVLQDYLRGIGQTSVMPR